MRLADLEVDPEALAGQVRERGYAIVPRAAPLGQQHRLRARAAEIVTAYAPEADGQAIFTTREQSRHADEYFLGSARTVRCFFEQDAVDPTTGGLRCPKERAINKIGHALHDLDPVFDEFSRAPLVGDVLGALGMREPLLVQSMYIFKQPGIGGEVAAHRDSSFLFTEPPSCVGFWWALQEATGANGCLQVIPGSHQQALERRFVVDWRRREARFTAPAPHYDPSTFVPVECAAGTLVVFDGGLVHASARNRSSRSREAYTVHAVEGAGRVWAADNWLQCQPGDPPLRGLDSR
jgi:phytanoyl-CoA hydroxylase